MEILELTALELGKKIKAGEITTKKEHLRRRKKSRRRSMQAN